MNRRARSTSSSMTSTTDALRGSRTTRSTSTPGGDAPAAPAATTEPPRRVTLIFYAINCRRVARQPDDALYFHAWWSRDRATKLGRDFAILPRIAGRGRFLGASVPVLTHTVHEEH